MTTAQHMRAWTGPAVLSYGFRPFFLLSGVWAIMAMAIWIAALTGYAVIPMAFDPASWHAHEFVFGYASAVIAGFLLTAIPNWTGRLPIIGWPLAGLVTLWLLGRLAFIMPIKHDALSLAAVDLSFGIVFIFFIAREIVSGRNWRNLPVLAILAIFVMANGIFHWDAAASIPVNENFGLRIGVGAEVMLISLIGGRIIPSFTRNWLTQNGMKSLPSPVGRFDYISLILNGLAILFFIVLPENYVTAFLCVMAGYYNFVRLWRWKSLQTLSEPLLWVLHVAFFCIVLGFFTVAIAAAGYMPMVGALHVWLVGGVGLMTLAVMTRATRGHTNRPLKASGWTSAIYILMLVSLISRYTAAILDSYAYIGWMMAGASWTAAFGIFVIIYGYMHVTPSRAR